jgi:hypothetical protein
MPIEAIEEELSIVELILLVNLFENGVERGLIHLPFQLITFFSVLRDRWRWIRNQP